MAEMVAEALFCFFMVFALLGVLYVLVELSSRAIRIIEAKAKNKRR